MINEEGSLIFEVLLSEQVVADEWIKEQKEKHPHPGTTIGGRFGYKFSPTGLGVAVSIHDNLTGEMKEVTDVSNW